MNFNQMMHEFYISVLMSFEHFMIYKCPKKRGEIFIA